MKVLAFESSCDETSTAVLENGVLRGLVTRTQTLHQAFGGVVPELASRNHLEQILLLTRQALREQNDSLESIKGICATAGPGLVGALLVGLNFAKGIALSLELPFLAVHHLEGHLWAAELDGAKIPLPFIGLIVSGGHTQLVWVEAFGRYQLLGSTRDDAVGEAYDKVGKLFGLSFPAGADIDKLAQTGDSEYHQFPTIMPGKNLDFSYSGLKTAMLRVVQKHSPEDLQTHRADLLAAFQQAAVKLLETKLRAGVEQFRPRAVALAGGVGANSLLQERVRTIGENFSLPVFLPPPSLCVDNAAMIAYVGEKRLAAGERSSLDAPAKPRWPLQELTEPRF
ncbi:tRNA (adenosine(37)-N6)-threonylcarbamoyltransferase complex transferase subunit TsaD [bacterium]|nr:tRNA (adenosine(37)-N6)-threonylcarbamoyltransferase complex transferase subunit TsaD [bacterium]